jgi:hypothetical protein
MIVIAAHEIIIYCPAVEIIHTRCISSPMTHSAKTPAGIFTL